MNIVWLSSYPKSGNTYLRFLLFSYIYGTPETSEIIENKIKDLHHFRSAYVEPKLLEREFGNRRLIDRFYRRFLETENNKKIRFQNNREAITYELLEQAIGSDKFIFMKTHFVFSEKHPLLDKSLKFIYLIRNPRDVLKSGVRYLLGSDTTDDKKKQLVEEFVLEYGFRRFKKGGFGSWVEHVSSWLNASTQMPGIFIKYESLKHNTKQEMERILDFLEIEIDSARLEVAIQQSSLESMRKIELKEKQIGLQEKSIFRTYFNSQPFVGSGKSNQSLVDFGEDVENQFSQNFSSLINLFGYL